MNDALIQKLLKLAKLNSTAAVSEDFRNLTWGHPTPWHNGFEDGQIELARDILTQLGIDWK